MVYRFESFVFDPETAGLLHSGRPVALEPQVFSLLKYLIENRARIVSKDELIEEIWEGRVVSDAALNTRIRAVRKALGDDRAKQKFLRTYPKRGFQFVAETDCLEQDIGADFSADDIHRPALPPCRDLVRRGGYHSGSRNFGHSVVARQKRNPSYHSSDKNLRLPCCRSTTFPATLSRNISPTLSPKI